MGLSAIDAWGRAAVDDGGIVRLRTLESSVKKRNSNH